MYDTKFRMKNEFDTKIGIGLTNTVFGSQNFKQCATCNKKLGWQDNYAAFKGNCRNCHKLQEQMFMAKASFQRSGRSQITTSLKSKRNKIEIDHTKRASMQQMPIINGRESPNVNNLKNQGCKNELIDQESFNNLMRTEPGNILSDYNDQSEI